MKANLNIILLVLVPIVFSTSLFSQALEFKVRGSWSYSVSASEIIEAGTDFSGTYESNANQVDIDLRIKPNNWNNRIEYTWTVDISVSNVDWHPDIGLYARVTDKGKGFGINPYMYGGETYVPVTYVNQQFFYGSAGRRNIKIQYELRDISVTLPAKSYSTTVIYTITSTF